MTGEGRGTDAPVCVEVRGQLREILSLCPPLYGFWVLKLGHQTLEPSPQPPQLLLRASMIRVGHLNKPGKSYVKTGLQSAL